jgi:hypothetical protein
MSTPPKFKPITDKNFKRNEKITSHLSEDELFS